MATCSIRMSDEEMKLLNDYAKTLGMTKSEVLRALFLERLEDEYNISLAEKRHASFVKDPKTFSHEAVLKLYDISD